MLIALYNCSISLSSKSKILFFSSKMEDENIDKLNYVERVQIDDDILTNPYTLAELEN